MVTFAYSKIMDSRNVNWTKTVGSRHEGTILKEVPVGHLFDSLFDCQTAACIRNTHRFQSNHILNVLETCIPTFYKDVKHDAWRQKHESFLRLCVRIIILHYCWLNCRVIGKI